MAEESLFVLEVWGSDVGVEILGFEVEVVGFPGACMVRPCRGRHPF